MNAFPIIPPPLPILPYVAVGEPSIISVGDAYFMELLGIGSRGGGLYSFI